MSSQAGQFRTIGVLGGMGAEATVTMMQRVLDRTDAVDDADHVPMIVAQNPQVPSRIRHLIEKTGPNPGPVLADMAAMLERSGAQALAMPCNTAHHYADYITERVSIPLLNMPQMACAKAALNIPTGGCIGILASPATNATGLFRKMLAEHGLETIFPTDEGPILDLIRRIKKSGPQPADVAALQATCSDLALRGAKALLIGCTEFSLLSAAITASVPVIDALDELVDAIIEVSGVQRK